jgi:hypothetical protein
MFTEKISYPHPVLGLNNDINGSFQSSLNVKRNKKHRKIRFYDIKHKIDNTYIQSLIDDGQASFLFKIYCSSTFKTWTIITKNDYFELDENDLYNKVEIEIFIITSDEISTYEHSSFNEVFKGFCFSLEKNDIIGISGKIIMTIEKEDEKLGIGSMFSFLSKEIQQPISFEYEQDKIGIIYPLDTSGEDPLNAIFSKNPWTAYNIFIIPALTGAFDFIDNRRNDAEKYDWFTIITMIFPEDNWGGDSYSNAQSLLKKELPVLKSFYELCK